MRLRFYHLLITFSTGLLLSTSSTRVQSAPRWFEKLGEFFSRSIRPFQPQCSVTHSNATQAFRFTRRNIIMPNLIPAAYDSRIYPYGHGSGRISDPIMHTFWKMVDQIAPSKPFAGVEVYGVQHVLGSTGGLLRGLAASGIRPSDFHILGKIYSENWMVVNELQRDGFHIIPAGPSMNFKGFPFSFKETENNIQFMVDQIIHRARLNKDTKFLILDDGGKLLNALASAIIEGKAPVDLYSRTVGVEQTAGGLEHLKNGFEYSSKESYPSIFGHRTLRFPFPVVIQAEMWTKVTFEPPMIGRSAVNSIVDKLSDLRVKGATFLGDNLKDMRILIVGLGRVNTPVATDLKRLGCKIAVTDIALGSNSRDPWQLSPDPTMPLYQKARRLGIHKENLFTDIDQALADFKPQVLVFATGRPVFNVHSIKRSRKEPLVMINLGSEGSEFPEFVALGQALLDTLHSDAFEMVKYKTIPGLHPPKPTSPYSTWSNNTCLGDNFNKIVRSHDLSAMRLSDLYVDLRPNQKGEFIIPYGGNPLNFGGPDPIPPVYIQLTRASSYISAFEALKLFNAPICRSHPLERNLKPEDQPVFLPARELQESFVKNWKRELKDLGLGPPERPTF